MKDIATTFRESPQQERLFLALVGLLQGLATWIVIRIEPHEPLERALCFGALAWILSSGLLFQFASSGTNRLRLATFTVCLAVPFALVSYHVVGQLQPDGVRYRGDGFRIDTWYVAGTLALYILLPYLQIYQRSTQWYFPYTELYRHSWNNFFLAALGWFYTGIYWALAWMCAGLFKAIGISAVETFIMKPSFIAITTGFMGGLGVALAKEHSQIITTLRTITATLFRSLTPMLVIIVLSFLATLPFTGLTPLWNTKWASAILLALLLLILLFVNAVFQAGEDARPYGHLLRRGVEATLVSMPILVGLTIYSMSLRIAQHGFTPERYYAIVFAIVLGGYGIGYAWSVVQAGQLWLGGIRGHNIALSFVVLGLAFTLHIPLMDPLKRSADDQEQRFLMGKVDVANFDFGTMRFELGHYGQAVLNRLSQLTSHPQYQQIAEQLVRLEKANTKWEWNLATLVTPAEVLSRLNVIPTNHDIPKDLLSIFQGQSTRYLFDGCTTDHRCDIVAGQWDEDPDLEYVLLNGCEHTEKQCHGFTVFLYDRFSSTVWKQVAFIRVTSDTDQLSRTEALLAAQEGRLVFGKATYHCLTMDKSKSACDYWSKRND